MLMLLVYNCTHVMQYVLVLLVYNCAHVMQCLWRPKERVKPPELEL